MIDCLLADYKKPEDLIGEHGPLKQLTKALVERALQAEMTEHPGHDKHETVTNLTGNARKGKSRKTLKGEFGELPIGIPRDREGSFEPQQGALNNQLQHLREVKVLGWNKRKEVAADLRLIYSAATIDEAEQALSAFEDKWNSAYPPIALSWRNNW